jgi:hypothetical protein
MASKFVEVRGYKISLASIHSAQNSSEKCDTYFSVEQLIKLDFHDFKYPSITFILY